MPNRTRDADAALALNRALCARGFELGETIINYPAKPRQTAPIAIDESFLKPGDLIVLTTRPPIHDLADGVRGRIDRGFTTLEDEVFDVTPRCSRPGSNAGSAANDVSRRNVSRCGTQVRVWPPNNQVSTKRSHSCRSSTVNKKVAGLRSRLPGRRTTWCSRRRGSTGSASPTILARSLERAC